MTLADPIHSLGSSGLKVSRIILGCMSYGSSKWADWVLDEEAALPLFKAAYDAGITTWDTADVYRSRRERTSCPQGIEKYNIPRNRLVIMSKCFFPISADNIGFSTLTNACVGRDWANRRGLSRKYIFDAVDASIERLGTYIDVLQIHRLDPDVPPEEVMEALNDVVRSGKFIAQSRGWAKFVSMQNFYNLLYREE
ncbi:NADP-dependent oxidoreductase domain-containing protein, partial [Auriculariales sp. MPI-PUGE-AT-0066]